jgi:hypothetical protein
MPPGEVSKRRHAGRNEAAWAWRQRSCANPDNGQLAGAIRPALPAVTDKPLAAQFAGARLDRPAVHIEPCRQFIGGKAMRASIADCALCHALEPPQLGRKGIGSGNRGFHVPVPRCIGIGAHAAPPSAIGGKPARSSNLPANRPALRSWAWDRRQAGQGIARPCGSSGWCR